MMKGEFNSTTSATSQTHTDTDTEEFATLSESSNVLFLYPHGTMYRVKQPSFMGPGMYKKKYGIF